MTFRPGPHGYRCPGRHFLMHRICTTKLIKLGDAGTTIDANALIDEFRNDHWGKGIQIPERMIGWVEGAIDDEEDEVSELWDPFNCMWHIEQFQI